MQSQQNALVFFTSQQLNKFNFERVIEGIIVDDTYGTIDAYFIYCDEQQKICSKYNINSMPKLYYISFGKKIYQFNIEDIYESQIIAQDIYNLMRPIVRNDNVFRNVSEAIQHLNQQQVNKYYIYESSYINESLFQRYKKDIDIYIVQLNDTGNQQNSTEQHKSRLIYVENNLFITKPDNQSIQSFIKKWQKDYLIQLTQTNLFERKNPQMRDALLVLRANRDINEVTQLKQFTLALKFGIITLSDQLKRDVDLVFGRFQLFYIDTQDMLFYVQPYGITHKYKYPVMIALQKDTTRYSKKSYSSNQQVNNHLFSINSMKLADITQNKDDTNAIDLFKQLFPALVSDTSQNQFQVPQIFVQFINFLKLDMRGANTLLTISKNQQNAVKIGKNQSYTPPSEGLGTRILEIIQEFIELSHQDMIIIFITSLLLGCIMAGTTKLALKQTWI